MARIVTDFVMVRFATKRFSFMRVARFTVIPWLEHRQIQYTREGQRVYFKLPSALEEFVEITPELGRKLAPFSLEIKRRLSAAAWMRTMRDPLSEDELRILVESNIPVIL